MSIDLSQLIGMQGEPDLGDALTSKTPSGDLLFQKPFGDSTVWRTATGNLRVTVIFDPFLPWKDGNLLASTTPNYFAEVRNALGRYLVPDKMAPNKVSDEYIEWEKIRSSLPDRTLHEYLQKTDESGKPLLESYVTMLKKTVQQQVEEDKAMIDALGTREFQFTFHLAVDAYPQEKEKGSALTRQISGEGAGTSATAATRRERLGVLVINISGSPSTPLENSEAKAAKIGIDVDPKALEEVLTPPSSPALSPSKPAQVADDTPTLRQHRTQKSKKAQRELETLLQRLGIDAETLEQGHNEWLKKLPDTTAEFFDQLNNWFSTLLQRKQSQLEKQDFNPSSMYH